MDTDSFTYDFCCDLCETEFTVSVYHEDEKPLFCPMCGSELPEE